MRVAYDLFYLFYLFIEQGEDNGDHWGFIN